MNQMTPEKIAWYENEAARIGDVRKSDTKMFSAFHIRKVRRFQETVPRLRPTPLISLTHFAEHMKVSSIRIKDESRRCGLNAFKVLGASYGIGRALAERFGMDTADLRFDAFTGPDMRKKLRTITLVTATDGNHGRAVAWMAEQLGCHAVVFMPRGSSPVRLQRIRQHGADVSVIAGNYDDAVELAGDQAERNDWLLLQDTAREGYEKIPTWIMQGYAAMIDEVFTQQRDYKPSHVFVQCGVGSFAAAIQAYLVQKFGDKRPIFIVVEPTRAACYFASMTSKAKMPIKIYGEMDTIMAGLACGEPSSLAWGILKDFSDVFAVCPDEITMQGMRILGTPFKGDDMVVSGESGAVTLGLLNEMSLNSQYMDLRSVLGLDGASDILLFSTEGDTDPAMYQKIVQHPWVTP